LDSQKADARGDYARIEIAEKSASERVVVFFASFAK
jgi:hypothetical protein